MIASTFETHIPCFLQQNRSPQYTDTYAQGTQEPILSLPTHLKVNLSSGFTYENV